MLVFSIIYNIIVVIDALECWHVMVLYHMQMA